MSGDQGAVKLPSMSSRTEPHAGSDALFPDDQIEALVPAVVELYPAEQNAGVPFQRPAGAAWHPQLSD